MEGCGPMKVRSFLVVSGIMLSIMLAASSKTVNAQSATDATLQSNPQPSGQAPSNAPLTLTLQDALQRAKALNPQFQSALTDQGLAKEDKVQARAGLLPNVNYTSEFIYTQGNGSHSNTPAFIANNGVHEYIAQGNVHQVLSYGAVADYRRTRFAEAAARARAEVAARGLVVTVVQAYYGFVAAQRKYATEQLAFAEAQRFLDISQKLEKGGEVAHSDVIKAQIQYQQQQRDLQEAELGMNKARLDLSVLLFRDFNENFAVVDDLRLPAPIATFDEVQAAGMRNNPDLRAAIAALREAGQEVNVAWGAMVPSFAVDWFYGIDAPQFATEDRFGVRNLANSGSVALQLPIWNWGAGVSKVKQAKLRRNLAQVELSATQRQLLANLRSFYNELQTARSQLELLSQSADLAAESLRLTTMRYQGGEATVLEVVDAQNTLTQARNAYDDGQVRFRVAQANVQTLTGTL